MHWLLLTHWLFRAQPLQHCAHWQGVSTGLGPQPAVTRLGLQQEVPSHPPLQHSAPHAHAEPFIRQVTATQTFAEQDWPHAQAPPHVTVRVVPQVSGAVRLPQFFPSREQRAASVSATQ